MSLLAKNIAFILNRRGEELNKFLSLYQVSKVEDLSYSQLKDFCANEGVSLVNLMNFNFTIDQEKTKNIKLLILDVDGVMTDGGMYFAESGDQFKKYNTKDGMGIMQLRKHRPEIQLGIISSGFKLEMVKARAELLKIQHVYVGRDPKMEILNSWCEKFDLKLSEVAIIGDDINDLEVMQNVGFSACPADAVPAVKANVDLVLQLEGGRGCLRELIDGYFMS